MSINVSELHEFRGCADLEALELKMVSLGYRNQGELENAIALKRRILRLQK